MKIERILIFVVTTLILVSCANRGIGPQGGPKDSIPPIPVKAEPKNGSVNFAGNRIEVTFNEYIQLDNISTNLLMSPPQQTPPDVKARGKRLLVHFVDSLRDSTTYTLDFGAAVCDYAEKNPLRGYSFAFSTGDIIDTLELHGRLYNAENLNPMPGIMVGIHSNRHDSAFTTEPFLRIAKTDSAGHWRIGNMREGRYRLYALDDVSRDYRFNIGEGLAFWEDLISPEIPVAVVAAAIDTAALDTAAIDTTATDSVAVDALPEREEPVLMFFREQYKRLYLQRTLREEQHRITLLFSSSPDSLPVIRAMRPSEIDSTRSDSAWIDPLPYMLMQPSAHGDTLSYWLTDSVAIGQDSIYLEARYRRTDSVYQYEWFTDTLRAVWRAPKLNAKAREAQERQKRNRRLELKCNAKQAFEIYDTLVIRSLTPIDSIRVDSIHLFEKVDSVLKPVAFTVRDTARAAIRILAPLQPGKNYELRVDSGAVTDIYGVANFSYTYKLTLKTPEDYSTLRVKIRPLDSRLRIQVLNNKDAVVRELPATAEGAFFQYLKPDAYYLRCYLDMNGDGEWTTGSWAEHRQPEPVYYYPQKIQTKSNWDFEEEWDYTAVPQMESKPRELIKVESKKK